jgi:DNA-binding PadR family transcriptional regulator
MENLSLLLLDQLEKEAAYGYILKKNLAAKGLNVTHQGVYKALHKLLGNGYIQTEVITQHGKPDRKVYKITQNGVLASRNSAPISPRETVSEFDLARMTNRLSHIDLALQVEDKHLKKAMALQGVDSDEDYIQWLCGAIIERIALLDTLKRGICDTSTVN